MNALRGVNWIIRLLDIFTIFSRIQSLVVHIISFNWFELTDTVWTLSASLRIIKLIKIMKNSSKFSLNSLLPCLNWAGLIVVSIWLINLTYSFYNDIVSDFHKVKSKLNLNVLNCLEPPTLVNPIRSKVDVVYSLSFVNPYWE